MKIAIITASLDGGAGIAAGRLHKSFKQLGMESILINKKQHDPDNYIYSSDALLNNSNLAKFVKKVRRKRIFQKYIRPFIRTDISFSLFSTPFSENRLHKLKILQDCDVINLHWTSGYIDLPSFLNKIKAPVFLTLHDTNYFTAGCHYFNDCNQFEQNCRSCPIIEPKAQKKLNQIFDIKEGVLNNKKHFVIGISEWIGQMAKKSSLMKNLEVTSIPNSFIPAVPIEHEILKDLNESKKIKVLIIAQHLDDKRKGWSFIEEIINSNVFPSILWVVAGEGTIPEHENCISLGTITSENELAGIYSFVDFLVHPAIQDNFPNTVVEALSYGTPVVAFETSGLKNLITTKNGILAKTIEVQSLSKAIYDLITTIESYDRTEIKMNALKEFSPEVQSRHYMNFFKKTRLNA